MSQKLKQLWNSFRWVMTLAQAEKVLSQGTHQTGLSNLIPARKSKEIAKSQNSLSQRQSGVH